MLAICIAIAHCMFTSLST